MADEKDHRTGVVRPEDADDHATGESRFYIDPKRESRMLLKFDFYAIGLLGLFYMMAILDRSNLGNAQVAGLQEDLNLVGNQFGTATSLLYATYVPFEAPSAILLKKIGPKTFLSTIAFAWGATTLGMAFIQSWKGLYACRLIMGFFESGLIPCVNVYLAWVYKKSERGKRSSVIFAFSAFASAFGGLLAYGLTQIRTAGFEGWRWLFAIEAGKIPCIWLVSRLTFEQGAMTIILVPLFYFVFPSNPTEAWFLTPEEKEIMRQRYRDDPHWGNEDEFSWKEVCKVFVDLKWYTFAVYQFSIDISLYGLTTFMPAIVSGLGYESYHANLMTVPIYMVALVAFLTIAFFSDRTNQRGVFLFGGLCCLVIGYAILISVDNLKVRFFACFVAAIGIYPTTGLSLMWLSDNVARHYKRASMVGLTLTVGNTAGVVVGQIFTTESGPRYIKGLSTALGFGVVGMLMVGTLVTAFPIVNRRRAAAIVKAEQEGHPLMENPDAGDYDVHFRYST